MFSKRYISFAFSLIFFIVVKDVYGSDEQNLIVETSVGTVRGIRADDGDYNMYLGIPYAQINRTKPFGSAEPYPKFEEIFEANNDSKICPQPQVYPPNAQTIALGTLDCLNLNIYTPTSVNSTSRLPVMVWIYGGGFRWGSARKVAYGPKFLVRHDVIVVSFNYRVGPYGFLCLDSPEVPGNQGLKDQVEALRWIRDNIGYFGGDALKVTIFGESAGGSSVDYHLRSGHEQLFRNAIMQSGTAFRPINTPDSSSLFKITQHFGLTTDDVDEALSFLSIVDSDSVIRAVNELSLDFPVCLENSFDGVFKMIHDYPMNGDIPKVAQVSVMIGYNDDEAILNVGNLPPEAFPQFAVFDSFGTGFNFSEELRADLKQTVRAFYIGDEEISYDVRLQLSNYLTDQFYKSPVEKAVNKFLESDAYKVYYYVFSYIGQRNIMRNLQNLTVGGAAHMDELGYLFDMQMLLSDEPTQEDQLIIDRMTTLWTNFAKYSNPTPEITKVLPVQWTPITPEDPRYHYINIESDIYTGMRPFAKRLSFWNLFYRSYKEYELGFRVVNGASSLVFSAILLKLVVFVSYLVNY